MQNRTFYYNILSSFNTQDLISIISDFFNNTKSHGNTIEYKIELLFNQLLAITFIENNFQVSGCSIDKLNKLLLEIDQKNKIGLFDRNHFLVKEKTGNTSLKSLTELKNSTHDFQVFHYKTNDNEVYFLPVQESVLKRII